MYWNENKDLKFQVHLKPNQKLKYLNSDSAHHPATFKAIPSGVLERLEKLTSKSKKIESTKIKQIYPVYCQAIKTAKLVLKEFLTFLQIENLRNQRTTKEKFTEKKEKEKKRNRQTYFCIGVITSSMNTNKQPPFHETIMKYVINSTSNS